MKSLISKTISFNIISKVKIYIWIQIQLSFCTIQQYNIYMYENGSYNALKKKPIDNLFERKFIILTNVLKNNKLSK